MRGQQVAFHAVSEKAQGLLAFFACGHALALARHAFGNPRGQAGAVDGVGLHAHARRFQRREPRAGFGGFVQPGQGDEGEHAWAWRVGSGLCGLPGNLRGQLLQGRAAFLAGLAGRDADFHDLLLRKEAERLPGGQRSAPVEVRAHHGVHAALGMPGGACGGADGVLRFLRQQRFIAVQHIQRAQPLGQVGGQLREGQLHGRQGGGRSG